jgi:hypothetical protein
LAYQKKVATWLDGVCDSSLVDIGPWFFYSVSGGVRHYCQPDVLVHSSRAVGSRISVVEIKLRWTADAWWQLRRLYLPVLRRACPNAPLSALCITRSYNPAIRIPEEVNLVDSLEEVAPDRFNVLIWKP